ncbi:outer membrane beta-barrel protein [Bradyrhizobium sp.]|uniref:outer membrane protein n=1 Tax=Bradyrhizobium sp. TaxID=376 RepID=UPI001D43B85B|nr:outer membrane beta-barrel protein [Bradyrhizobium sp.]MBI5319871.1 porin family protein [Bradyrhizobium sp.]
MRKIVLGLSAAVLGATSASAADLAARPYTKVPAPVISVYNWTGFYVGINGGGGSSRKCWDLVEFFGAAVNPIQAEGCHNATGGTAGGQVGYRWQATNWVFGVEAQGNWANFRGSNANTSAFGGGVTDVSKIDAFGLFTGQIGYAVNSVLFYVKGGAAVVRDKYDIQVTATGVSTFAGSETRWGGAVGAGVEFGFAPNWSVALEYDHLFMGRSDVRLNSTPAFAPIAATSTHRIGQDVDIGTVRVNYRFGGPVVAKY